MFRMLRLKPPHGWHAVTWELLIVTLGVLIALGAQQLIETANWRRDVADFRASVRAEMSRDLWTYPFAPRRSAASTPGSMNSSGGWTAGVPGDRWR